jgi:hypothetical protein
MFESEEDEFHFIDIEEQQNILDGLSQEMQCNGNTTFGGQIRKSDTLAGLMKNSIECFCSSSDSNYEKNLIEREDMNYIGVSKETSSEKMDDHFSIPMSPKENKSKNDATNVIEIEKIDITPQNEYSDSKATKFSK